LCLTRQSIALRKRTLIRILTVSALLYALVGIAYYHAQERILFRSVAVPMDHRYDFGMPSEEVFVTIKSGTVLHITKFPVTADVPKRGTILYFHGNRRNVSWYADRVPFFTSRGYEVWMPDYPGFGKSTGMLDEETLYEFARQTYLMARKRNAPDSMLIYGRSMGTGIAAWLASQRPARGLVLETPYRSIPSLVGTWMPIWPVGRLSRFRLPAEEYLLRVSMPVSILHGSEDRVIPISHAAGLRAVLKGGDRFTRVEGAGHNDLPGYAAYTKEMDSLLIPRE
jgi:pimeloyl-ACP methyl ester carboxylesterase